MTALTAHTSRTIAEVGYLLIVIAGIWFVSAEFPIFKFAKARTIVAGLALAAAGILLIVATHWGPAT